MIRLAVFGSPVSQSRSPAIHGMFADQCGLDVDYRAIEATAESFSGLVRKFADGGGLGCNITAPFKQQAWQLARRDSSSARRARAANTLVFEKTDDWYADNTDGRGLLRDLSANLGFAVSHSRICIIGAGGAAAGILGDLLEQQPASITIANRTVERARELQGTFVSGLPAPVVSAISLDDLGSEASYDLIINATSLGHETRHPGLPASIFHSGSLCYDLNYGAAAEPLRIFCGEKDIRYEDGLGMLVEQAALSFELWTGHKPDTAPVLKSLLPCSPREIADDFS